MNNNDVGTLKKIFSHNLEFGTGMVLMEVLTKINV